jgi:hypothetical protein
MRHLDIATWDGQAETIFVTVPNSLANGKRITGPPKAMKGPLGRSAARERALAKGKCLHPDQMTLLG